MTTIKLKNGSGAPAGGDLVQGEPALDLTNKRLYTEDSGGNVIEVGTNPGVDVTFADNRKALFGAGSDLQIYHDGSNSYIKDAGAGDLIIQASDDLKLQTASGTNMAVFTENTYARLFYNGTARFETTNTGIDVTGTAVADSYDIGSLGTLGSVSTDRLFIATADGLGLQFDFDNSRIVPVGADGSTYNNNVSLGSSGLEFKNLLLSGNATVGGTSLADTLETSTASGGLINVIRDDPTIGTNNSLGAIYWKSTEDSGTTVNIGAGILALADQNHSTTASGSRLSLQTTAVSATSPTERLRIGANGDISFYEDTGTTAKLFWDASAESLGIGTSSPSTTLEVTGTGDAETGITATHSRSGVGYTLLLNNTNNGANKGSGIKWQSGGFDTGAIITRSDATAASGDAPAYMTFHTSSDGSEDLAERMRITSSGLIQIGNAGSSSSPTIQSLIDPNTGIFFGGADILGFSTGGSEAMRIDSSGNLLVGKTNNTLSNDGTIIRAGGELLVTNTSDIVANFNRTGTDGPVATFYKDGTTVGSIGSASGDSSVSTLFIADAGNVGIRFDQASTDDIQPCTSAGANRDAAINLGAGGNRFKDLHMSGNAFIDGNVQVAAGNGILLGGTDTANKLDDYEEGTWTVDATGAGNLSGTGLAYEGKYTKIGNTVICYLRITTTADDLQVTSYQLFTGLPFTASKSGTGTVITEDIDQFSRQGFASIGGTIFAISKCGSATGTTAVDAMVVYMTS